MIQRRKVAISRYSYVTKVDSVKKPLANKIFALRGLRYFGPSAISWQYVNKNELLAELLVELLHRLSWPSNLELPNASVYLTPRNADQWRIVS